MDYFTWKWISVWHSFVSSIEKYSRSFIINANIRSKIECDKITYSISVSLFILSQHDIRFNRDFNSNEGESVHHPRDISIERFQEGCVLARGVSRGHETRHDGATVSLISLVFAYSPPAREMEANGTTPRGAAKPSGACTLRKIQLRFFLAEDRARWSIRNKKKPSSLFRSSFEKDE